MSPTYQVQLEFAIDPIDKRVWEDLGLDRCSVEVEYHAVLARWPIEMLDLWHLDWSVYFSKELQ
jgi:hypothetical protein